MAQSKKDIRGGCQRIFFMSDLEGALVLQKEGFCSMILTCADLIDRKEISNKELLNLDEILEMLPTNPIARRFLDEDSTIEKLLIECVVKIKGVKDQRCL